MFRAMSLAIGITLCVMGLEFLFVEKLVLASPQSAAEQPLVSPEVLDMGGKREYQPPDWMAWCLMSGGTVVILYSFTIPRRVNG